MDNTRSNFDQFAGMGQPTTQSLPPSVQCSPIFVEYQLMKEFVLFQKQNLAHVYMVPSHASAFEWFGIMFIHHGLYARKCLRFTIYISTSYPNCDVPKIIFNPIPVHPFVNRDTGELDTSFLFTKWNSSNNFIFEIIAHAKHMFEINDVNDLKKFVHNQTFSSIYETNELKSLIAEKMSNFNEQVVEKNGDDRHYIHFARPENMSVIEKLRHKLINEKVSPFDEPNNGGDGDEPLSGRSNYGAYNGHFGSPSISGLSWTKKMIFK